MVSAVHISASSPELAQYFPSPSPEDFFLSGRLKTASRALERVPAGY